jgi:CubicO group peptidase (beta-lactamase class C family)
MQFRAEATTPSPSSTNKDTLPAKLSSILENARIKNGIPGMAVSVLYKGELIFAEGFGKRNDEDPFTKDVCLFPFSLSRAFFFLCKMSSDNSFVY